MSDAEQNLVERMRFVFSVPSWPAAVGASLVVAGFAGAVGFGATPVGVAGGLLLLGVPAVVATVLTPPLDRRGDGAVNVERSALLALVSTVIVAVFVVGVTVIQSIAGVQVLTATEAVLLASLGIATFRLIVMVSVSGPPLGRRVVPAEIHSGVAAVMVFGFAAGRPGFVTPATLGVVGVCAVLYAGIAFGFVVLVDRPLGRDWGISGFEFVHQFLEYAAERPNDLDAYFTRVGERVRVPVTVLSIRRPSGEEKARVVSTLAHPGPFAGIGGSTLPYRLTDGGPGLTFTPHGMADHDYDPTSQTGVTAVCDAAERALADITYDQYATPPRQRTGETTLTGQGFGDGAFIVSTFAPLASDDVNHRVGRAAASRARDTGIENPLLVDAHNCQPTDGADGHTAPGTDRARALTDGVERMAADLAVSDRGRLHVGVAADSTPWGTDDGIGALGIRALATEVNGITSVFVFVDGNNMVPGLRNAVRDALDADVVEILTTDTHEVNHLRSANYVGTGFDNDEFVSLTETVGTAAIADLEPVESGTATTTTELTVFGEGTVEGLTGFGDYILPRCAAYIVVASAVVTAIAVVLFWLV